MHTMHFAPSRVVHSTLCAHTCICTCTCTYAQHCAFAPAPTLAFAPALCTMHHALCTMHHALVLAPALCTMHYALVLVPCTSCSEPTLDLCGVGGTERGGERERGREKECHEKLLIYKTKRTKYWFPSFIFHKCGFFQ